jgi:hypothetical protein
LGAGVYSEVLSVQRPWQLKEATQDKYSKSSRELQIQARKRSPIGFRGRVAIAAVYSDSFTHRIKGRATQETISKSATKGHRAHRVLLETQS